MGGITGTAIYAEIYPLLEKNIVHGTMVKSLTISSLFDVNPWIVIISLSGMILSIFYIVRLQEKKNI